MTIWGFRGRAALLRMRCARWDAMVRELGVRGSGVRESGAFLLGDRHGDRRTVRQVVYFDDLDATCLTGGIALDGLAYSRLWDICDETQRRVIGDVHTHPRSWVGQSSTDAANPMIAQNGHIALIIPDYASHLVTARDIGLHRYLGDGWENWTGAEAARRLFLRRYL